MNQKPLSSFSFSSSFQSQSWYRKHISKHHQINRVSNWLANKQLTTLKKTSILSREIKLQKIQLMQLVKFLTKITTKQRPGIDRKLIKFIITILKFHFENKEFIEFIASFLEYRCWGKDTVIVREGEKFGYLYLLLDGKCEIVTKDMKLSASGEAVFGEKELFSDELSKSTIKCRSDCEFLVIKSVDFKNEKKKVQGVAEKKILSVIRKIPLFRCFQQSQLVSISKHAQIISLQEKGNIIKQGKKHAYFYIVINGEFQATQIINMRQKMVLNLDVFDIVNLEGICDKAPLLNVKNVAENSELYKFQLIELLPLFRNAPKIFKDMLNSKYQIYKKLTTPKQTSPERYRSPFKSDINLKITKTVFLSQIPDTFHERNSDSNLLSFDQPILSCQLKSKVSLFTKVRRISGSSDKGSGSIRSKISKLVDLSNIHQNIQVDVNRANHFMLSAYKQKIQSSNNVQLDVQNRLYHDTREVMKKMLFKQDDTAKTNRLDQTMTSWKYSHQYNQSEILQQKRSKTGEGSREKSRDRDREKRKDTEILLKRVQMSSCRKKRNRIKVMFDPREIIDFNQTQEIRGLSRELEDGFDILE